MTDLIKYDGPQKEFLEQIASTEEPILFGHPPVSIERRLVWRYEVTPGVYFAPPSIEKAIVYKVGNRRFLTKKAAIKTYAWQRIKARYQCKCEPDVGYNCGQHEYVESLAKRYIRYLKPRLFKP